MSSALRLGLSRPAATGASHLLRPHPASHIIRSTAPILAQTRAQSWSSRKKGVEPKGENKKNKKKSDYVWMPEEVKAKLKSRTVPWAPPTSKIKRTGLPKQGQPVDQDFIGAPNIPIPNPYARDPHIPDYPYGPRRIYKQSNYGLYGNARIRFGNNVTEKHNVKTPRVWRPNVQRKRLWSFALGCWVQTRLTMRVLRTIDKVGGLDNYLLGDKAARIKEMGPWGWKLRWRVMQSDVVKDMFHQQRLASHDEAQESLESQTAPDPNLTELVAEMDHMIASGADIPFGIEGDLGDEGSLGIEGDHGDEGPLGIEGPLEIEDMTLEPEAGQDEAAPSLENEVGLGAEEAKDQSNPLQNVSPTEKGDVGKDEGFMKEGKP